MSAIHEGDVSLIHDEDKLKKMWQETEDFGKKKEIRAHMYKLREARLRDFYNNTDISKEIRTTNTKESKSTHADSLADHSFLSLKSKEIRDSESPTRDVSYRITVKPEDREWIVAETNERSLDGKTYSSTRNAETSGIQDIPGGKLGYEARNKLNASVYQDGDDNNFTKSVGRSSNSFIRQEAVVGDDNSNYKTSSTKSSSSSKTVTENKFTSDNVIQSQPLPPTSRSITDSNVVRKVYTTDIPAELKAHPSYVDGKTTVTSETHTMADGTVVKTTKYEIKDANVSKTESSNQYSSNNAYEERYSSTKSSNSQSRTNKNVNQSSKDHRNTDGKTIHYVEKTHTVQEPNVRIVYDKNSTDNSNVRNVSSQQSTQNHRQDINKHEDIRNEKYYTHEAPPEEAYSKTTSTTRKTTDNVEQQRKSVYDQNERVIQTTEPQRSPGHEPEQRPQAYHQPERRQPIKPTKTELDSKSEPTQGQYDTTYRTDYTNKRISVDVSPTHDAFVRSLRAVSPDRITKCSSPNRETPRNLKSSHTSLRGSQSPDKDYRHPSRISPERRYPDRCVSPKKTPSEKFSSSETITYTTSRRSPEKKSPDRVVTRSRNDYNTSTSTYHVSTKKNTVSERKTSTEIDSNTLTKKKHIIGKPKPRSRSPSPTSIASDIEYFKHSNEVTTDLDEDVTNSYVTRKTITTEENRPSTLELTSKKTRRVTERSPTSPLTDITPKRSPVKETLPRDVPRKSSLKSTRREPDSPSEQPPKYFTITPTENEKPRPKDKPLIRTDTYEERCRQILGITNENTEKRRGSLERKRGSLGSTEVTTTKRSSFSTTETTTKNKVAPRDAKSPEKVPNKKSPTKDGPGIKEFPSQIRKSPEKQPETKSSLKTSSTSTNKPKSVGRPVDTYTRKISDVNDSVEDETRTTNEKTVRTTETVNKVTEFPSHVKKTPSQKPLDTYETNVYVQKSEQLTEDNSLENSRNISEFTSETRPSQQKLTDKTTVEIDNEDVVHTTSRAPKIQEFPSQISRPSEDKPSRTTSPEKHIPKRETPVTKSHQDDTSSDKTTTNYITTTVVTEDITSRFKKPTDKQFNGDKPIIEEFPSQKRQAPERHPFDKTPESKPKEKEFSSQTRKKTVEEDRPTISSPTKPGVKTTSNTYQKEDVTTEYTSTSKTVPVDRIRTRSPTKPFENVPSSIQEFPAQIRRPSEGKNPLEATTPTSGKPTYDSSVEIYQNEDIEIEYTCNTEQYLPQNRKSPEGKRPADKPKSEKTPTGKVPSSIQEFPSQIRKSPEGGKPTKAGTTEAPRKPTYDSSIEIYQNQDIEIEQTSKGNVPKGQPRNRSPEKPTHGKVPSSIQEFPSQITKSPEDRKPTTVGATETPRKPTHDSSVEIYQNEDIEVEYTCDTEQYLPQNRKSPEGKIPIDKPKSETTPTGKIPSSIQEFPSQIRRSPEGRKPTEVGATETPRKPTYDSSVEIYQNEDIEVEYTCDTEQYLPQNKQFPKGKAPKDQPRNGSPQKTPAREVHSSIQEFPSQIRRSPGDRKPTDVVPTTTPHKPTYDTSIEIDQNEDIEIEYSCEPEEYPAQIDQQRIQRPKKIPSRDGESPVKKTIEDQPRTRSTMKPSESVPSQINKSPERRPKDRKPIVTRKPTRDSSPESSLDEDVVIEYTTGTDQNEDIETEISVRRVEEINETNSKPVEEPLIVTKFVNPLCREDEIDRKKHVKEVTQTLIDQEVEQVKPVKTQKVVKKPDKTTVNTTFIAKEKGIKDVTTKSSNIEKVRTDRKTVTKTVTTTNKVTPTKKPLTERNDNKTPKPKHVGDTEHTDKCCRSKIHEKPTIKPNAIKRPSDKITLMDIENENRDQIDNKTHIRTHRIDTTIVEKKQKTIPNGDVPKKTHKPNEEVKYTPKTAQTNRKPTYPSQKRTVVDESKRYTTTLKQKVENKFTSKGTVDVKKDVKVTNHSAQPCKHTVSTTITLKPKQPKPVTSVHSSTITKVSRTHKEPHSPIKSKITSDIPSDTDEESEVDSLDERYVKTSTEKFTKTDETTSKITRTNSDQIIKQTKQHKTPTRGFSKPELISQKVTPDSHGKTPRPRLEKKCISTKSIIINNNVEREIIVDLQRSKSSREPTPDRMCPLPVSSGEETSIPRYPDQVTEPDDGSLKRTPKKLSDLPIMEDGTEVNRIVDVTDDLAQKITKNDRVEENDESLLTVNKKINRFLDTAEKLTTQSIDLRQPAPKVQRPKFEVDENLGEDECLLSVSDKVSKFITTAEQLTAPQSTDRPKSPKVKNFSNLDSEQFNSISNRVDRFTTNSLTVDEPRSVKTKPERPDVTNVEDSLRKDDCLLSVADKVTKFISTAEKLTTETRKEPLSLSKIDVVDRKSPERKKTDVPSQRIVTESLQIDTEDDFYKKDRTDVSFETFRRSPTRTSPSKSRPETKQYPVGATINRTSPTRILPSKLVPKSTTSPTRQHHPQETSIKSGPIRTPENKSLETPTVKRSSVTIETNTVRRNEYETPHSEKIRPETPTFDRNRPRGPSPTKVQETTPTSTRRPSQEEKTVLSSTSRLRSTESIKKAKAIFENIGNSRETARQKDILNRPSVFQGRKKDETVTTTYDVNRITPKRLDFTPEDSHKNKPSTRRDEIDTRSTSPHKVHSPIKHRSRETSPDGSLPGYMKPLDRSVKPIDSPHREASPDGIIPEYVKHRTHSPQRESSPDGTIPGYMKPLERPHLHHHHHHRENISNYVTEQPAAVEPDRKHTKFGVSLRRTESEKITTTNVTPSHRAASPDGIIPEYVKHRTHSPQRESSPDGTIPGYMKPLERPHLHHHHHHRENISNDVTHQPTSAVEPDRKPTKFGVSLRSTNSERITTTNVTPTHHAASPDGIIPEYLKHRTHSPQSESSPDGTIPGYMKPLERPHLHHHHHHRENISNDVTDEPTSAVEPDRKPTKFGVNLRRTDSDKITSTTNVTSTSVSNQFRRHNSTQQKNITEDEIEQIFDLEVLEELLLKVTGYEIRRKIRAQIRIVKKQIADKTGQTKISVSHKTPSTKPSKPSSVTTEQSFKIKEGKDEYTRTSSLSKQVIDSMFHTHKDIVQEKDDTSFTEYGHAYKSNAPRRSPSPVKSTVSTREKSPENNKYTSTETPDRRTTEKNYVKKTTEGQDEYTRKYSLNKEVIDIRTHKNIVQEKDNTERVTEYEHAYKSNAPRRSPSPVKSTVSTREKSPEKNKYTSKETPDRRTMEKNYVKKTTEGQDEYTRKYSLNKQVIDIQTHKVQAKDNTDRVTAYEHAYKGNAPKRSQSPLKSTVSTREKSPEKNKYTTRQISDRRTTEKVDTKTTLQTNLKKSQQAPKSTPTDQPEWVIQRNLRKAGTSETVKKVSTSITSTTRKGTTRSASPKKDLKPTDSITSSYGVGPTDENGTPLFGLKALRTKNKTDTTKVQGTVISSRYYSENGQEPVGQVSITKYSTDPRDLSSTDDDVVQGNNGITSITTTQKFGYDNSPSLRTLTGSRRPKEICGPENEEVLTNSIRSSSSTSSKVTRRNSVKALTQKFVENAVETSKSERQSPYPKAGLILRTSSFKDTSPSERRDSRDEDQTENTVMVTSSTSRTVSGETFLSNQTQVSGVQDVITRMTAEDVEEGDSAEDIAARGLLNKFLGTQVILSGLETGYTRTTATSGSVRRSSKVTTTVTEGGKPVTKTRIFYHPIGNEELETVWDESTLRFLLEQSTEYEERKRIRARLRHIMTEQEACTELVEQASQEQSSGTIEESVESSKKIVSEGPVTTTRVTTKVTTQQKQMSPFAKFRQLDKQNSLNSPPSTPKTPSGSGLLFKFTDPALSQSASTIKDRLLHWCRMKTKEYENIQLDNFSTSWADGLAFCALVHHFLPDAFDYHVLTPKDRRHNFTLAFKVADEKADIAPLLDVDDMVATRRPDWKCVFTYVQSIYRRFKDED